MSSKWNYVVKAQDSSCVSHSVVGNFTSPEDRNIIIAKGGRIEIYLLCPHGQHTLRKPMLDVPLYGRIVVLELIRPEGEAQGSLFIVTERLKFCLLQWDTKSSEIITSAMGDVSDPLALSLSNCQFGITDPDYRSIGLLYDGLLKVIPVGNKRLLKKEFNIKLSESYVLDIKFLCGCTKPTIALLYQDKNSDRHVKTFGVSLDEKKFVKGPWSRDNLAPDAELLISVAAPLCGALIVAEKTITYCSATAFKYIFKQFPSTIKAYGRIDEFRYLLGDQVGLLYMCVITHEEEKVTGLTLNILGETSIASTISHLDSGVVFVGSSYGDSQLIKLNLDPVKKRSFVKVLERYVNLGPVTDFCVVDREGQGEGQVVTCSGAFRDGSLRIVRNWRGFNEQGSIKIQGIKRMWSLKSSTDDAYVTFLVISFVFETRILALNLEGELEETKIDGFLPQVQTLFCHDAVYNQLIQVVSKSVRLVSSTTRKLRNEWHSASEINVATANNRQVLLATDLRILVYLAIGDGTLELVKYTQLKSPVSCLDINPIGDIPNYSQLAAVGMWGGNCVTIFALPELTVITEVKEETVPRSVLLCAFEKMSYLLCSLEDGHLLNFQLDTSARELKVRKKVPLGTCPINLGTFSSNSGIHVFAASDRPSVIYSSKGELLYKKLNMREANHICAFNSAEFPDRVAIARQGELTIGTIDDIQKLDIQTIPLGGYARCICHQEQTRTFGVCIVRGSDLQSISLFDDHDFRCLSTYKLSELEHGFCILSCSFSDSENAYYCVGTGYDIPLQSEPTQGRILVFRVKEGKLRLIGGRKTTGAVYSLSSFHGKLLASINQKIHLFKPVLRNDGYCELQYECGYKGHRQALSIQTRGDLILVGDIVKSLSLLKYKPEEGAIELLARDYYNAKSVVAVQILDEDIYLGAESNFNLFTARKNIKDAKGCLEVVGEYHLGELVSMFHRDPEMDQQVPAIIFGTSSGVIGRVASVPQEQYMFFEQLQCCLRKAVPGVGMLGHAHWRSFSIGQRTSEFLNILDGDLIQSALHLSLDKMEYICKELGVEVDDLCKRIEKLSRFNWD